MTAPTPQERLWAEVGGGSVLPELMRADIEASLTALAAVTAERDQARQMLADAPHDKQCASRIPMQFHKPWPCDCWKAGQ